MDSGYILRSKSEPRRKAFSLKHFGGLFEWKIHPFGQDFYVQLKTCNPLLNLLCRTHSNPCSGQFLTKISPRNENKMRIQMHIGYVSPLLKIRFCRQKALYLLLLLLLLLELDSSLVCVERPRLGKCHS